MAYLITVLVTSAFLYLLERQWLCLSVGITFIGAGIIYDNVMGIALGAILFVVYLIVRS